MRRRMRTYAIGRRRTKGKRITIRDEKSTLMWDATLGQINASVMGHDFLG